MGALSAADRKAIDDWLAVHEVTRCPPSPVFQGDMHWGDGEGIADLSLFLKQVWFQPHLVLAERFGRKPKKAGAV